MNLINLLFFASDVLSEFVDVSLSKCTMQSYIHINMGSLQQGYTHCLKHEDQIRLSFQESTQDELVPERWEEKKGTAHGAKHTISSLV